MLQLAAPWLLLLLPVPWLARGLLPAYRPARPAAFVPFMKRLQRVTGTESYRGSPAASRLRLQWILLALIWLALVAALAVVRVSEVALAAVLAAAAPSPASGSYRCRCRFST